MRAALEAADIEFIDPNAGGAGVHLRKIAPFNLGSEAFYIDRSTNIAQISFRFRPICCPPVPSDSHRLMLHFAHDRVTALRQDACRCRQMAMVLSSPQAREELHRIASEALDAALALAFTVEAARRSNRGDTAGKLAA